jgi:hypothetical protein
MRQRELVCWNSQLVGAVELHDQNTNDNEMSEQNRTDSGSNE